MECQRERDAALESSAQTLARLQTALDRVNEASYSSYYFPHFPTLVVPFEKLTDCDYR